MKYSQFNFYTLDDIFNIAKKSYENDKNGKEKLEKIIESLNNKNDIIVIMIKNHELKSSEDSYTPEIQFSIDTRYFIKVDDTMYTDSKEFYHMAISKSKKMLLSKYLDNLLQDIKRNQELSETQLNSLGDIKNTRIKEEYVEK